MIFISTHAPAGGATARGPYNGFRFGHFYSRPCGRGDFRGKTQQTTSLLFLLTPLREGRPWQTNFEEMAKKFLLTPLREGRPTVMDFVAANVSHISTHAPAGGATDAGDGASYWSIGISTHAPAGGATPAHMGRSARGCHFYSRPCGRGDGDKWLQNDQRNIYFYSRPCGRGDAKMAVTITDEEGFLLTPLREGRRVFRSAALTNSRNFYSRPCGRGDETGAGREISPGHFYSRPCGRGDRKGLDLDAQKLVFLLTPLREGRPDSDASMPNWSLFLLTPLREGRLCRVCHEASGLQRISTHAPAGGATKPEAAISSPATISTHAPAGGATRAKPCKSGQRKHFYSRPCGRGDQHGPNICVVTNIDFYSRPCGRGD